MPCSDFLNSSLVCFFHSSNFCGSPHSFLLGLSLPAQFSMHFPTCLASVQLLFLFFVPCLCPNSESSSSSNPSYLLNASSFASDFLSLCSQQPKTQGDTNFITHRNAFLNNSSWYLLLRSKLSPTMTHIEKVEFFGDY